jgi:hypothetical protein
MSGNGKDSKNGSAHPFLKKDPKPTRARLVSLLDPLGRKRYSEVERYLATVQGATSGLFYYGNAWGWAVRYLIGAKNTLCTLHLLPSQFEASVQLGKEMETLLKAATLDSDLKRRLAKSKVQAGAKCVRTPIKNDHDYAGFKTLIQLKAESLKMKKPVKPAKKDAATEKPDMKEAGNAGTKDAGTKETGKKAAVKKETVNAAKPATVKKTAAAKSAVKKPATPAKLASKTTAKSR